MTLGPKWKQERMRETQKRCPSRASEEFRNRNRCPGSCRHFLFGTRSVRPGWGRWAAQGAASLAAAWGGSDTFCADSGQLNKQRGHPMHGLQTVRQRQVWLHEP